MSSNFYRLANLYNKDIKRSDDLYELINVENIPGRTGPIATIRLVTGTATREISTDYLLSVSEEEASTYLCDLREELLRQADIVGKSVDKLTF